MGIFDTQKYQVEISSWSLNTNERIISSLWILSLCESVAESILPTILIGVTDKDLRTFMRKMLDGADRIDIQSMMKFFVINSGLPLNQLSIRRSIFHAFNHLKKVQRPSYFKPEWDKLCSHVDVNISAKYTIGQRKKIGWKYAVSTQAFKTGILIWKIKYIKSSYKKDPTIGVGFCTADMNPEHLKKKSVYGSDQTWTYLASSGNCYHTKLVRKMKRFLPGDQVRATRTVEPFWVHF